MKNEFEFVRAHLATQIAEWTRTDTWFATPVPGLTLYRHVEAGQSMNCMLEPAIALPVQGTKRVRLGTEVYEFDRHRFLVTSLDLPVVMQVENASLTSPFLSAVLRFDTRVIGELIMETQLPPPERQSAPGGMVLGDTTEALVAAFDKLIGLLKEPEMIPVLAPLIQREIFYRILRSDVGGYLWHMASIGSQNQRIGRAIDWLKANFRESLRVDELAAQVDMSPSRFHHHFRRLTSMSPLQFQKWLRLAEARRLMVMEGMDASVAAYDVGYESPSQFSREYTRQFGASPRRDVESLLQNAAA